MTKKVRVRCGRCRTVNVAVTGDYSVLRRGAAAAPTSLRSGSASSGGSAPPSVVASARRRRRGRRPPRSPARPSRSCARAPRSRLVAAERRPGTTPSSAVSAHSPLSLSSMIAATRQGRFSCATISVVAHLTRRRLIAAGGLTGAAALLHARRRDRAQHDHRRRGRRRSTPGHEGSGHADFRDGADGRPRRQRLRPARDRCATSTGAARRRTASGRVIREWELVALDREIEVAPGRELRRLDLQRPRPRPDAALPRGRAAADHVRQRLRAPAHDPLPRHPPGRDGRRAGARRRADRAGRQDGLRVRRAARRAAPLPLPRPAAGRAHRQGPLRRVHRGPEGRPRGRRRARDGHERVRHELRPRERALRRELDPVRLHEPAARGPARRAHPGLRGQRARVRPDQLVPPAREPVRLVPDGHVADGGRVHRHGDALPGPARDRRVALPDRGAGSCSTRTSPSSPSSAGRASSRCADGGARRAGVGARPPGCSGSSRSC